MSIKRTGVSLLLIVLLSTGLFGFLVPHVSAQTTADSAATVASTAGLGTTPLPTIIGNIINVFLGILGVIFLVLTIYAGYTWMTAMGDEKAIAKAKNILISAVIGLVIILASYAITSFIVNSLIGATTGTGTGTNNGTVSTELLSGALGSGAIRDHYPTRNQTDVARNTNIMVTFKSAMDISSFITGYNTNGTPTDTTDDVMATAINASNVLIYVTADGSTTALTDAAVSFSSDLKTFVFNPVNYLGSATENVQYTVALSSNIKDGNGDKVFTGTNSGGYEWSFETGTVIDLLPPTVTSVSPSNGSTKDRNVLVQMTFSEAIDPTTSTGTRGTTSGFDNITVVGTSQALTAGTYEISNGYKTITFVPTDACGTNSCNETIYCLPGAQLLSASIKAATVSATPPSAMVPFDGIVDMAGNSLDGNDDGTAGDVYAWDFSTTGDINLTGPLITVVRPTIKEEDVALDQDVSLTFDGPLDSSSINSDNILLTDKETTTGEVHDLWYRFDLDDALSVVSVPHGTFLESVDGKTYLYGVEVRSGVLNEYQNCYVPARGPDVSGGSCAVSNNQPYCCNGTPSASVCSLF